MRETTRKLFTFFAQTTFWNTKQEICRGQTSCKKLRENDRKWQFGNRTHTLLNQLKRSIDSKSFVNMAWPPCVSTWFSSQQVYFLPMHHVWNITFVLEEEAFDPDCSQRGDESGSDDLPWLQFCAAGVDLSPALLQVQQEHLLVHFQGTLDTQTHASVTICEACFGFTKDFMGAEHHFSTIIYAFCVTICWILWVLWQTAHNCHNCKKTHKTLHHCKYVSWYIFSCD